MGLPFYSSGYDSEVALFQETLKQRRRQNRTPARYELRSRTRTLDGNDIEKAKGSN